MAQIFLHKQQVAHKLRVATHSANKESAMRQHATCTTYLRLVLLLGLVAGLGGCSWFSGELQDPSVQLQKVEVVRARLVEQEFLLHLRLDNPNDSDLPIRGMTFSLYLNDIKLADGESDVWATVPANGHRTLKIPLRTNLWSKLKPIAKMLEKHDQPIRYRFYGVADTGVLFGSSVHLERNGEIIPGDFIPE
jgi:LEA14-like dessication related protein